MSESILALAAAHTASLGAAQDIKPRPGESITLWKRRIKCYASAVNPSQIPEAIAAAAKRGVSIDFTPDGRAIYTSRAHRKEYLEKVRGLFDMDGGIGDPKPTGVDFHFNLNPR